MGWRLLVLSLLAHGLLATEEEDGSGMGSADGSGEGCIEPVPRPGLLGGTVATAGDLEPRCHLACIERVRRKLAMHIVKTCKLYAFSKQIALEEGISMEVSFCKQKHLLCLQVTY